MSMHEVFESIRILSMEGKYPSLTSFCHLVEEVGEVGTCFETRDTGRRELTEPVTNECVDVVHCALEIFFKEGGTIKDFMDISSLKRAKWRKNLCKSTSLT